MVGYCRQELGFSKDKMVCTKTLYNWIGKGLLRVRNIELPIRVRLKPRKTKSQSSKNQAQRQEYRGKDRIAQTTGKNLDIGR